MVDPPAAVIQAFSNFQHQTTTLSYVAWLQEQIILEARCYSLETMEYEAETATSGSALLAASENLQLEISAKHNANLLT